MAKLTPAEQWHRDHEAELLRRADAKATERAERRAANVAANQAREALMAAGREETRATRIESRAAKSEHWAERMAPTSDPFVIEMASRFRHTDRTGIEGYQPGDVGCSPEEFVAWQQRQRDMMRSQPSIEEQLARAPKVGSHEEIS